MLQIAYNIADFSANMLQIACKKLEILAPKCNKKHANQGFGLQNAASSKENCPILKNKKHPKKQDKILKNIITPYHPISYRYFCDTPSKHPIWYRPSSKVTLRPGMFSFYQPDLFRCKKLRSLSCLIQKSRWFTLPTFTLIAFVPFPLASSLVSRANPTWLISGEDCIFFKEACYTAII